MLGMEYVSNGYFEFSIRVRCKSIGVEVVKLENRWISSRRQHGLEAFRQLNIAGLLKPSLQMIDSSLWHIKEYVVLVKQLCLEEDDSNKGSRSLRVRPTVEWEQDWPKDRNSPRLQHFVTAAIAERGGWAVASPRIAQELKDMAVEVGEHLPPAWKSRRVKLKLDLRSEGLFQNVAKGSKRRHLETTR